MWVKPAGRHISRAGPSNHHCHVCCCQVGSGNKPKLDPEAVTKKWGLEAGLFNIFTSKEEAGQTGQSKGQQVRRSLTLFPHTCAW